MLPQVTPRYGIEQPLHVEADRDPRMASLARLLVAADPATAAQTDQVLAELCADYRARSGVQVVTIVPGYVATPLTQHNSYAMPFLMTPEAFADQAFKAIAEQTSYRVIPWQMGVLAKLLRLLPNAWFDRALQGRPRKHRAGEGRGKTKTPRGRRGVCR